MSGGTISDNAGDGVRSNANARVTSSVVSGNGGSGVQADRGATVKTSTVTANDGDGIAAEATVRLREATVGDNGFDGVRGRRVVLTDASATGNGTSTTCGVTDERADLASPVPPRLNGASTCGTSRNTEGASKKGERPEGSSPSRTEGTRKPIKAALGKLRLPEPVADYVTSRMADAGVRSLAVEHAHALRVATLPRHHGDPFDRLLIAQADLESVPILTTDRHFRDYGVRVLSG